MNYKVDKDKCIGCGACVSICPNVFDFNDDGFVFAKGDKIDDADINNAKDAFEGCPTDAIEEIKELQ